MLARSKESEQSSEKMHIFVKVIQPKIVNYVQLDVYISVKKA